MQNHLTACAALILSFCPASNPAVVAQSPDSTPPLRHSYVDDDDQRRLADLQFSVDPGTGHSLRISISATGPDVEPIGGFRGIHGSNRYTAEELDLVLRGLHEAAVITETPQGDLLEGLISPGDHGRLMERRVISGGEIDFLFRTEPLPLSIHITTAADSDQWLRTTVVIDGQSRLTCRYQIQNGKIVHLETQSLGHDGYIAQEDPAAKRRNRWMTATVQEFKPPVDEAEWTKRDLEGKWGLLTSQLDAQPERISKWVAWLVQEKQFELLEWLAIYRPDAFKSHGVGKALLEADAPQWIRVAAWHRNTSPYLGHSRQQATQMLLEASPAVVEHWLQTHQESLDNWNPALGDLFAQLQRDDTDARDSSKYLSPLQPNEIFDVLSSSGDVVAFGDRLRAEDGVVYEHQVVRAINAVIISGRRSEEVKKTLRTLIDHKNERIRIEALLAHSFLLPGTQTERPSRFLKIIDDEQESEAVRQAALLGVSYQNHPSLILRLHEVASTPEHPAWKAAVSRIGDIGKGYSALVLNTVPKEKLNQEQFAVLVDSMKRLAERELSVSPSTFEVAQLIRLASIAKSQEHIHADLIHEWVRSWSKMAKPKVIAKVKQRYSAEQLQIIAPIWAPDSAADWQVHYNALFSEITSGESSH